VVESPFRKGSYRRENVPLLKTGIILNSFKRQEMKRTDAYRKEKVAFYGVPKVICSQEAHQ